MNDTLDIPRPTTLADWLALPDDVMAGIFEEIEELRQRGTAQHHWAWRFVQPFLNHE
ncbi:MAG: hypothetical protein JWR16_1822 [Nevskia sp.]|nr:hypothetical protein [Nevskia sp.]